MQCSQITLQPPWWSLFDLPGTLKSLKYLLQLVGFLGRPLFGTSRPSTVIFAKRLSGFFTQNLWWLKMAVLGAVFFPAVTVSHTLQITFISHSSNISHFVGTLMYLWHKCRFFLKLFRNTNLQCSQTTLQPPWWCFFNLLGTLKSLKHLPQLVGFLEGSSLGPRSHL